MMSRCRLLVILLLSSVLFAQTEPLAKRAKTRTVAPSVSKEIQELRDALQKQQQQIELQQEQIAAQQQDIQRLREETLQREREIAHKLMLAEATSVSAQERLAAADEALENSRRESLGKLQTDVSEFRSLMANTAATVDEAKKASTGALESGFGHIRFNGLLQVWGIAGDAGYKDTFRVRRTELKFTGNINAKVRWTVMIDPSKNLSVSNNVVNQASRILQDAFVTSKHIPHVQVDVGQFKIPLSLEGSESSVTLPTMERALFMSDRARGGSFGDIRDIGVMISGPLTKYVDFYLGEFNSSGDRQNDVAVNDQKATIGRVVIKPTKWLQLGTSGAFGNGGAHPDRPRRDRLGAEFLVRYGGFTIKSEWMQGKDGDVLRQGYYALTSYRFKGRFEPVFRFDTFDPDVSHRSLTASTAPERDFIAGMNWYLSDTHFKLQANYLRKTYTQELLPSRNLMFVNVQTSW